MLRKAACGENLRFASVYRILKLASASSLGPQLVNCKRFTIDGLVALGAKGNYAGGETFQRGLCSVFGQVLVSVCRPLRGL